MSFAGTPIDIALVAAVIPMLFYAAYIFLSPSGNRPPLGALILLFGAWWIFCQFMEYDGPGLHQKLLWNKLQYISMAGLPVAWLGFSLQHTGRGARATFRNVLLVCLLPAALLALTFTNDAHGLMWRVVSVPTGETGFVEKKFAIGFWIFALYMYTGIIAGAVHFAHMFAKSRHFYRRQARSLLAGAALPLLAGVIDLAGINPSGFDVTPLVVSMVSLVVVVYGFARLKFKDTVPLAFESAIESLREIVLVLDMENRIIYVNRAGFPLFEGASPPYVGKKLDLLRPELSPLVSDAKVPDGGRGELVLGDRFYDVTVSPLADWRGGVVSRIVVLREITHLKTAQARLLQMNEELEAKVLERTRALSQSNRALEEEIVEHQRAEETVRASLKEKEVLLKEIHHRVKNNLQVISSLLRLPTVTDPYAANVLDETYNRIRSIAVVHEILYKSNDLSKLQASSYIESLLMHLESSFAAHARCIAVSMDVEDVLMSVDAGIACGLLINELVSNSFRHAFPDGRKGSVRIRLRARGNDVVLSVADDGIGIPEAVDVRSPHSLGLTIVNTLTKQIHGEMEVKKGGGTEFILTFKLKD